MKGVYLATGEVAWVHDGPRLDASPEDGSSSPYTEFVGHPMMLGDALLTITGQADMEAFR